MNKSIEFKNFTLLYLRTYECNFTCPFCFNKVEFRPNYTLGTNKTKTFIQLYKKNEKKVLEDIFALGLRRIIIGGGEPLLISNTVSLIRHLKKYGWSIRVETNGSTLTVDIVKALLELEVYICLSFDSLDSNYCEQFRGPLDKIVSGFETVKKVPGGMKNLHINCTLTQKNIKEIPDLLEFFRDSGVQSVAFQIAYLPPQHPLYKEYSLAALSLNDRKDISALLKDVGEKNNQERELFSRIQRWLRGKLKANECPIIGRCITLDPFGNIYACPHRMDESFLINANYKCSHGIVKLYPKVISNMNPGFCCNEKCIGFHT